VEHPEYCLEKCTVTLQSKYHSKDGVEFFMIQFHGRMDGKRFQTAGGIFVLMKEEVRGIALAVILVDGTDTFGIVIIIGKRCRRGTTTSSRRRLAHGSHSGMQQKAGRLGSHQSGGRWR